MPEISVVTTLYNSADHLEVFYRRVTEAIRECYSSYELIFVNDGSTDDSLAIAQSLLEQDARLRIIDLTRNFGQHQALMAGIKASKGQEVLLVACDLEEDPGWLSEFKTHMEQSGAEVVYGVHVKKDETFFKRLMSRSFYRVFNKLSPVKLTPNIVLFRLMKRGYVRSLLKFEETVLFLPGIMELAGHKQLAYPVRKLYKGSSSYSLKRLVYMAIDAITSFSTRPLTLLMLAGLIILGTSFLSFVALAVAYINGARLLYTNLFILMSVWAATGLLLTGMGMVGLYASRALIESKRRPQVIVKASYTSEGISDEA